MIATLASIGLPGLNGFVGEFLILLGTFKVRPLWAALGATGVILAAWYMLWMVQRVFFGGVEREENRLLRDLVPREVALLVPLVACMVWIGVAPTGFLKKSEPAVGRVLARVQQVQQTARERTPWKPQWLLSWYLADRK